MKYCIEIIRDENGDVVERNILFATTSMSAMPRGKECVVIDGPSDIDNVGLKMVSVDENSELFIEDDPDKLAAQAAEDEIALRVRRMDFGRRLIAIISIRNDVKEFTQEQILQFMSDYSEINTALLNGSIGTAKAQIQAITPDGVITTQGDKDALLGEITAKEAELGYS